MITEIPRLIEIKHERKMDMNMCSWCDEKDDNMVIYPYIIPHLLLCKECNMRYELQKGIRFLSEKQKTHLLLPLLSSDFYDRKARKKKPERRSQGRKEREL